MRVRFRQNRLDFKHADHRQKADKEQKQGEEQAEGTDKHADIDPCRMEHAPRRRDEIAGEGGDYDGDGLIQNSSIRKLHNDPHPEQMSAEI